MPTGKLSLTTPPTTIIPIDVREVKDANPVTMDTISSSWVIDPWGNGGKLVLTGVIGICLVTWGHRTPKIRRKIAHTS